MKQSLLYNSTDYQAADLDRMSAPDHQVRLFQRCGFDVSYAVLPVEKERPQFTAVT